MVSSVPEALLRHAAAHPEKLCIADAAGETDYGTMASLSRRLSVYFASQGIGPGEHVVVECMQRTAFLEIEFGIQLCGGIFVPLEARCSFGKMARIAAHCGAKLLICAKAPQEEEAFSCSCPVLTYAQVLEAVQAVEDPSDAPLPPDPDAVCEILFSTGTTGKEKGVVLTHRNNVAVAENVACGNDLKEDNVELVPSPLNHSHGLRSAYANLLAGASLVFVDNVFDMKRFYAAIDRYHVTSMDLVPAALTMILNLSREKLGEYREQLRYIEFGSAPLRTADKERLKALLPQTAMNNFYGSTESGRSTVYNFNVPDEKHGCIGHPTKNARIFIVDADRRPIASDRAHTGLLASGGAMNMVGYFRDEEETASAMADGILYTKDEAYFDEDGEIMLLGRADDVINVGGRKVSPEEIENIVRQMPQVADCACIGIEDGLTGKAPKVFVEMKEGEAFDAKAVKDHIRAQTEAYKVPKVVEQIEKIPRTYNGKLLRRLLR